MLAPTLYQALKAAVTAWTNGKTKDECVQAAVGFIEQRKLEAQEQDLNVPVILDYIEFNDLSTFRVLDGGTRHISCTEPVILSGALCIDGTRLIDNIIIGDVHSILRD